MTSKRKFYRTEFKVVVLSEEPLEGDMSLGDVRYEVTEGHCSGSVYQGESKPVGAKRMAKLLIEQQSDPEFFGIDKDGNEVKER